MLYEGRAHIALLGDHPTKGLEYLGKAAGSRMNEALPLYGKALSIREEVLGPSHPLTAEAREMVEPKDAGILGHAVRRCVVAKNKTKMVHC